MNNSRLKADSIGWMGQFFQAIAHMAPAIGIVLNAQLMASRAGSALPLASLFAGILAILLALCLGMLTRKYYGASGYFQIHSRALGSGTGFITSWLFFLYEPFNAFFNFFGFGFIILEPFSEALGYKIPWWATVIVGNLLITFFSLTNIRRGIRTAALLSGVEVLVFVALAVALLAKSDHPFNAAYFMPSSSADGVGGLLFAFIFGFMAFVGFESGLPLTEETKNAKTATYKGLVLSVLLASLFYVFVNYATVVGFGGGENSAQFAKDFSNAQDPYSSGLAFKAFGTIGAWLIVFAAINSTLGCCLAGQNACARVIFALGRSGILPKALGQVDGKSHVPVYAVLFSSAFTFLVTGVVAFLVRHGNKLDWFGLFGVMIVLPLLIIHLMTCVSVFVTYRRREGRDFCFLQHGALPLVAGLLVLLPIGGSIYYNLTPPISYAPWIVLTWFVVGIFVYMYLRKARPRSLTALEKEMSLLTQD